MSRRRVVVTGMGMLTPLGNTVAETWAAILAGRSGIGPIETFDVTAYATQFGGGLKGFDVEQYIPQRDARRMDPFIQYGMAAGIQAFEDAAITVTEANAERIGVAIGSGIGGLLTIEQSRDVVRDKGPKRASPFFVPSAIINMISGNLSIRYGLKGPNIALATACTTGAHNIGISARLIQSGDADVMVCGGAEMATTEGGLAGFSSAKALSTRNEAPQAASRPWDRDRDGFVLSDGAGALVLEEYEHAKARGARILAELAGFGMSADAHHITSPPEDGAGAAQAMRSALLDARLTAEQIQYINAHGTSTPLGDVAESKAIESLFGEASRTVAVSSTKSMIGHLLGAAGAVEAIFCILALRDQVAPPTINLDNPDPECRLDYVPHQARPMRIDATLSNSFGFGGTNGSLVFSRMR